MKPKKNNTRTRTNSKPEHLVKSNFVCKENNVTAVQTPFK